MALQKQITQTGPTVSIDFPLMPRLPAMTISADHQAMQQTQGQLDMWYQSFRQSVVDKLQKIQDQVDAIKKG